MEEKIIEILDNLTIKQAEKLLDENIEIRINGKNRNDIRKSVFQKAGLKNKRKIYIPGKLVACVTAFAIIFTTLSLVGFDKVAASIGKIFTFIPGIGIIEKTNTVIYTMDPIVSQIKSRNMKANIVKAIYSNNYLSVNIEVYGRAVSNKSDLSFYINQELKDYQNEPYASSYSLGAVDLTAFYFSYKIETPARADIYEFAIAGFSERLSFKLIPCSDYSEIKKIGPTDMQNGISITAAADRADNQLIVWCYPFKTANTTKDTVLGYGEPGIAAFNKKMYIETEAGQIFDESNFKISERAIFNMPENTRTATLHIPYLSMSRNEKRNLSVNFPKDYTTVKSNISIKCSLGAIRVTEVERKPSENEKDKDTIRLKLAFDSNDGNMALSSFNFENTGVSYQTEFNAESGCMETFETDVRKNESKISFNISGLNYYLFGEYVIPLDVK